MHASPFDLPRTAGYLPDQVTAWRLESDVLVLEDLDDSQASVQRALDHVRGQLGELPATILYRAASGVYDGIVHRGGVFAGCYPIGARNVREALKRRHE